MNQHTVLNIIKKPLKKQDSTLERVYPEMKNIPDDLFHFQHVISTAALALLMLLYCRHIQYV